MRRERDESTSLRDFRDAGSAGGDRFRAASGSLSRRGLLKGVATAGVGLGIVAPDASALTRQENQTQAVEWVLGLSTDVNVLDPNLEIFPTQSAFIAHFHIFDTLTSLIALRHSDGFDLVPGLAESWTLIDDTTWEFKLRQGVKWHNGDDFVVEDVIYSIEAAIAPESWRTTANQVAGAEIVDPTTVRVFTKGPQAALFIHISGTPIMPRNAREAVGAEVFDANPIGTGPYRFVEWRRGERLVLEANSDYWSGPVDGPSRLVLRSIPDATSRVSELATGGVQIIDGPPAGQIEQIQSDEALDLVALKGARLIQYRFNTKDAPLDDVRVRQALNMAIDRDTILANVLGGFGELLHGPFASAWLGYDADLQPYAYDPAAAAALLAEAGYGEGFETVLNFASTGSVYKGQDVAEVIAAQLGEIGVKLDLRPTEPTTIDEETQAGTASGISQTTWGTSADPDIMMNVAFFNARLLAPDQHLNDLIAESKLILDPTQREPVLKEIGRHVHDQALWLFIHAQDDFWAKRTDVSWSPYPITGTYSRVLFHRPA